jgi:hypothetical protein
MCLRMRVFVCAREGEKDTGFVFRIVLDCDFSYPTPCDYDFMRQAPRPLVCAACVAVRARGSRRDRGSVACVRASGGCE